MEKFDVVIIGGGLAGLETGAILSKEGLGVCVLEQQKVIGGCLQSFHRKGRMLDTGIHYIGSLCKDQILHRYFTYMGIMEKLKTERLDPEGYDRIQWDGSRPFFHVSGLEGFQRRLLEDFPEEKDGIEVYCSMLDEIGKLIAPEILESGIISGDGSSFMGMSAYVTLTSLTSNPALINVLSGINPLYGYHKDITSFYEHAMIQYSNIEGAHRLKGSSQQLADALVEEIQSNGGIVLAGSEVKSISVQNGMAQYVQTSDGRQFNAERIISAIHPAVTLGMLEQSGNIRPSYFQRIGSLENSFGLFTTYLLMKQGAFPYFQRNDYMYIGTDVWERNITFKGFPISVVVMMPSSQFEADGSASVIALSTPMDFLLLKDWANTTTGNRGSAYTEWKEMFADAMIEVAAKYYPGLREAISSIYTASPLTYRDYNGIPEGSAYGILKDWKNPLVTRISPRTKIPNLYFTGQNLNVHGCLGVTLSAVATCAEILGMEYLSRRILMG